MLRRRIEKLEAALPPKPAHLEEQWEARAVACLGYADRELLEEGPRGGREVSSTPEFHRAVVRYKEALEETLREFSDEELDRMIALVKGTAGKKGRIV